MDKGVIYTHKPREQLPRGQGGKTPGWGGQPGRGDNVWGMCAIHAHSFISKAGRALGDDTLHQVIEVGVGKRQCGGERAAGLRRRGNG